VVLKSRNGINLKCLLFNQPGNQNWFFKIGEGNDSSVGIFCKEYTDIADDAGSEIPEKMIAGHKSG